MLKFGAPPIIFGFSKTKNTSVKNLFGSFIKVSASQKINISPKAKLTPVFLPFAIVFGVSLLPLITIAPSLLLFLLFYPYYCHLQQ